MIRYRRILVGTLLVCVAFATAAAAQPLGTFRWQLRSFCNVVAVAITQNGAVYRLEGTDDQCGGGADAASVTGTAFPNADGTIGFGLNIVTTPGGRPLHVDADISLGTFSGTWRDSAGASGTFAFTPGAGNGGSPRPLPSAVPTTIQLLANGGVVANGALGQGAIPASGPGVRMMWYPGKAAFRAGRTIGTEWDDASVGTGSVAFGTSTRATNELSTALGFSTTASGTASTAMGISTTASGNFSTAMGNSTTASGVHSTAMGIGARASETASTAMGDRTTASGLHSTAMGSNTTASGINSTAIGAATAASGFGSLAGGSGSQATGTAALAFGNSARANGNGSVALGSQAFAVGNGSFVFADSTAAPLEATGVNQFFVRAAGGVRILSNANNSLGVRLDPGDSQWSGLSDVNAKHRFRDLSTEDVLARVARMPVTEWSYRHQDAVRHIGPTAQDFHAAFGLGQDPLRIGTLDASGVALAGVRALEARTRSQAERIDALERKLVDALAALCVLRGDCP